MTSKDNTYSSSWRDTFHSRGPSTLVIAVVAAVIIYEISKRHSFSTIDIVYFCALIIAVVFHEVYHGFVAYLCGDDTAKRAGRLTLNPIRHIDIFGSIILPVIMILTVGVPFGWAKPVPVTISKLRSPRNQAVLVGLAGPVTNIILAFLAGIIFKETANLYQLTYTPLNNWPIFELALFLFGEVNVLLACFNLLPIPPLDGSALLERILPRELLPGYYKSRMYFMFFVLAVVILAPGFLDSVSRHALQYWEDILGF